MGTLIPYKVVVNLEKMCVVKESTQCLEHRRHSLNSACCHHDDAGEECGDSTNTLGGVGGTAFLPKTGSLCSSWKVLAGVRAVSRCTLKACGTRCATTFGTRRKHRWCAGSWAAGQPSPPRERPTMARARAPSSWMMCSVRELRPIWGSAPTPAGSPTTAGMGKTLASPAWVNAFLSSLGLQFPFFPVISSVSPPHSQIP